MGPWGNIGLGLFAAAGGVLLIVATQVTGGFAPVAWLGFAMTAVGVLLVVIGVIGAGVKSGNDASRR